MIFNNMHEYLKIWLDERISKAWDENIELSNKSLIQNLSFNGLWLQLPKFGTK